MRTSMRALKSGGAKFLGSLPSAILGNLPSASPTSTQHPAKQMPQIPIS